MLQVTKNDSFSQFICTGCWECIENFHGLYLNIEHKHKHLYDKIECETKEEFNVNVGAGGDVEYVNIKQEPNVNALLEHALEQDDEVAGNDFHIESDDETDGHKSDDNNDEEICKFETRFDCFS